MQSAKNQSWSAPLLKVVPGCGRRYRAQADGRVAFCHEQGRNRERRLSSCDANMPAIGAFSAMIGDCRKNDRQILTCKNADNAIRWREGERLDHLFEARCDQINAGAEAVVAEHAVYTFRDIDNRANQLARYLTVQGTQAGDRVGLMFDKSVDTYVALLAVLKRVPHGARRHAGKTRQISVPVSQVIRKPARESHRAVPAHLASHRCRQSEPDTHALAHITRRSSCTAQWPRQPPRGRCLHRGDLGQQLLAHTREHIEFALLPRHLKSLVSQRFGLFARCRFSAERCSSERTR